MPPVSATPIRGKEPLPVVLRLPPFFSFCGCWALSTMALSGALPLLGLLSWVVLKEDLYCVKAALTNPVNNGSDDEWHSHIPVFHGIHPYNFTDDVIESYYSLRVADCWEDFTLLMSHVASRDWCNWAMISRPYSTLQLCLEEKAEVLGYYYPNAYADLCIIKGHKTYFSNCTSQYLFDPPEDILLPIIFAPICIIPFLVTLVVWKSKNGKPQI
ncbi:receptor activity-modifying protein 2-like [Rhinatrema bivittatum]|uniref:receptor activity-modifying protein 2-like n=1 Tax=Rhinatrema bivittatum TaxID=194408 RepID=UPI0011290FB0|nr:receptor activity-modifying protein 2-like [Rhinatrema bivittatum]